MADLTIYEEQRSGFMAPFGQAEMLDARDGLRMTLKNGDVVHLRASGNAAEFRVYVEASSPERDSKVLQQALNLLREKSPQYP